MSPLPRPGRRLALAAAALLAAAPAGAQDRRTVEFTRQLRDTLPLEVVVDHGVGKVVLHGADQPLLYQAQLAYDPRRSEPVYDFDAAARRLRIGARRPGDGSGGAPELRLDLARTVPVALTVNMGTAAADLDLGGMRLTRLAVESGASDAVLHFDAPNRVPMERLDLDVGAASLRARGLGNARARDVRVRMNVGSAELDFDGEWSADVALQLQITLGKVVLRVPDDVGVRVETSGILGSFDESGFERRGDAWLSPNWDSAPRKLVVRSRTTVGRLEIRRGAS